MTVIDEFIIKFKSDAGATTADVKKLDDEISKLAAKGQKRSDEETKQLKELRKLRTDTVQDVKDQTKATDSLTESLIGLGISAVAAFAGFEAIKKVTSDANDLNLNLQKTRALTGQNAEEIQAWDQAFERFGAPGGQFTEWFTAYSQYLQKTGQDTKQILPFLRSLSEELHSLPEDQARQRFQQAAQAFGLPQEFYLALRNGGQALEDLIKKQGEFIKSSQASEDAARRLSASWQNAWSALLGLATLLEQRLIPYLTYIGDIFSNLFSGHFGAAFDVWRNPGAYKTGGGSSSSSSVLPLISQYESGGRNVPNASGPGGAPASTASGYYQITNGTWRDFAPKAGVSLSQYPTAMSAPFDVQTRVASQLYAQRGLDPWSSNTRLLAAIGQNGIAQADQSSFNTAATGGGSQSLSIGSLTVQTQAKDAPGIADAIVDELNRAYRATIGNWDDGVVK